jgi:PAS domain-containing protein
MVLNNFAFTAQKPPGQIEYLWAPILAPIILFFIDSYLIPQAFLLPLLLIMLLCYLALRLPAWMVAGWAVVYTLLVLLVAFLPLEDTQTLPALRPYVRTAFLLVSGTTATLLAIHRGRLEKGNQALVQVVSMIPLAVVVSDISGDILLINQAAEKLLRNHLNELSGLSYFSTFISPQEQGRMIAKYISYFQGESETPHEVTLCTRGEPSLTLHTTITVISLNKTLYAVTIVDKVEEPQLV